MKLRIQNSLMSLISVAKYTSIILGVFVFLFGFELNQASCLAPLIACDPRFPSSCQPYNCPQIIWPYVSGAGLIIVGILLWVVSLLTPAGKGSKENADLIVSSEDQPKVILVYVP
jgi:hypothetical protein